MVGRVALVDTNLHELVDSGVFQYPADRYAPVVVCRTAARFA